MKDKITKIKVGFSVGDMNGIGPEVLLQSLSQPNMLDLFTTVIYGPVKNLLFTAKHLGIDISYNKIKKPEDSHPNKINVVDFSNNIPEVAFGELDKKMGALAFLSIEKAVLDLNAGKIDVLVTPPINKEAIHSDSFTFMGHTDYIDSKVNGNAIMMMISKELRIALLTEHIPISSVTKKITKKLVHDKVLNIHQTLIRDFQIEKPKIAVLSIDPHAGDGGVIAGNDKDIMIPALREMQDSGVLVYGPFSSDSFFGSLEYKKYDITIASYHDQGLIPFKTLSFGMGVNYTSGLDRIRTSPDHGTAYSIAGKGLASKDSFLSAVFQALDIFKMRKTHDEYSKDKL